VQIPGRGFIISSPPIGGHRIILWGYRNDPEAVQNLCLIFKKCIMKIMSKSPSRHLVRLEEKLKMKRKKYLHIPKFLLYFSLLNCTNHRLISVTDSV
jgi:hypothetical protein